MTTKGSLPRRVYVDSSCHHPLPHSKRETEGVISLLTHQHPSLARNPRRRGQFAFQPIPHPLPHLKRETEGFTCPPTTFVPLPRSKCGRRGLFCHPHSLPVINPPPSLKTRAEGSFSSPTLSACHQPPPSLKIWAEGSLTLSACHQPLRRSKPSGGVYPHSLPATNPFPRPKHGQRVLFCHPHTLCLPPPPPSQFTRNVNGGKNLLHYLCSSTWCMLLIVDIIIPFVYIN
jgi:hypothetical protein